MRILQIHNLYRLPGGENMVADDEAETLQRGGHHVDRVRIANPSTLLRSCAALTVAPWNPLAERRVEAHIESGHPDVGHVHNTWFSLSPAIFSAFRKRSVPVVMHLHNFRLLCVNGLLYREGAICRQCLGSHPWHGVVHRCYRSSTAESAVGAITIALNRALGTWENIDRLVAPSMFVKQTFVEAGFDPTHITVKPSAVPDPGPRDHPPSRSRTVLYAGRLSAEKGIVLLLEAWRRSSATSDGLELAVVGDGPLRDELEHTAPAGVRFAGWRAAPELARLLREARALIFPSECYESGPRMILEAFAAGLPVLASDLGGPAELVSDLGRRWLVSTGDADAWADALGALTDDQAIDVGGRHGRQLFVQRHSFDVDLQRLVSLYESVGAKRAH